MSLSQLVTMLSDGRAGAVRSDAEFLAESARNTAGIDRTIGAVVYPESTSQVVALVHAANDCGAPLYPISTGRNWGMGSRVPVRNGGVVVDLGKMNRIREIDARHGYVSIEPGVTQAQLSKYLLENDLPYGFNVTGSASYTSIVGCSLDRGVGYFSGRVDSLAVSEVVLGTGQVLKLGFGHFADAKTAMLYRHGVGPSLEGLFFQSSLGIVTAATFELIPKAEQYGMLVATTHDEEGLGPFIDAVAACRQRGIITTAMHIANRARSRASLGPLIRDRIRDSGIREGANVRAMTDDVLSREVAAAWSAVAGITGSREVVRQTYRQIAAAMPKQTRVRLFTRRRMDWLERLTRPLASLASIRRKRFLLQAVRAGDSLIYGVPNDASLGSIGWPLDIDCSSATFDPDKSDCGLLYVLPIVPLAGDAVVEVVDYVNETFERYGFEAYVTLNVLTRATLEGVINVVFRRSDEEAVARAHDCIETATRGLMERGYSPYRVGVQAMGLLREEGDEFWSAVRALKQALDPSGVIAPGRYDPLQ